jgi:hypothetical protein
MPLVRLIAEGVGPFERLDLDFSDGNGKPHLGPHILAGVNGSGKSTALRTIAWLMDKGKFGFQYDDWGHFLEGHPHSRAVAVLRPEGIDPYVRACTSGVGNKLESELSDWARSVLRPSDIEPAHWSSSLSETERGHFTTRLQFSEGVEADRDQTLFNIAAYSPSKALKHLPNPDLTKVLSGPFQNCLAFDETAQNDSIQAWLLSLYSKRAIARERRQSGKDYDESLGRFEAALGLIYGEDVSFEVEIEPDFQPRLKVRGKSLNFSQLPDGIRSTVAWIADFMMREDQVAWSSTLKGKRPGLLLLDEIDAHLHPLWQRLLLPAMREALPDVQIIVTSHSPFVISSCPNSRVHVLKLDAQGRAYAEPPVDSPIGESVTTTLKEIFGVDSRFDVKTERELNEWNDLKKQETTGSLSKTGQQRLRDLTSILSSRSEELRSIVASPLTIPDTVLHSLLETNGSKSGTRPARKRRATARR